MLTALASRVMSVVQTTVSMTSSTTVVEESSTTVLETSLTTATTSTAVVASSSRKRTHDDAHLDDFLFEFPRNLDALEDSDESFIRENKFEWDDTETGDVDENHKPSTSKEKKAEPETKLRKPTKRKKKTPVKRKKSAKKEQKGEQ